jgi:hypothetical protein
MAIYPRLMGVLAEGGRVVFVCKECNAPPQEAIAANILIVCSNCGKPLGEWNTPEERAAEMRDFEEKVRVHAAPIRRPPRAYQSKQESKSKNMPHGGGGRKRNPKRGRKQGRKQSLPIHLLGPSDHLTASMAGFDSI